MEVTGKIFKLLPLQQGEGRNGPWKKQEFILETDAQVSRKICFSLWGDKVDQFPLAEAEPVEVMFDLESREFNGRWYTDAKAWKITKKVTKTSLPADAEPVNSGKVPWDEIPPESVVDDLPF